MAHAWCDAGCENLRARAWCIGQDARRTSVSCLAQNYGAGGREEGWLREAVDERFHFCRCGGFTFAVLYSALHGCDMPPWWLSATLRPHTPKQCVELALRTDVLVL